MQGRGDIDDGGSADPRIDGGIVASMMVMESQGEGESGTVLEVEGPQKRI